MRRLPADVRARQLGNTAETIVDLADDVDPERDHIRGNPDAPVTLLEYGDFECPYCGHAAPIVEKLLDTASTLRYVFRHLPLTDVHPNAQTAAEAAEAAGAQGAFWEMHDRLLTHQDALAPSDIYRHAADLGLDINRFSDDLRRRRHAARVAEDVRSADESGVSAARRRSSSTAAATWASTTRPRSRARSRPPRRPRSAPRRGHFFGLGRLELGVLGRRRRRWRQLGERLLEVPAAAVAGDARVLRGVRQPGGGGVALLRRSPACPCRRWPRGRRTPPRPGRRTARAAAPRTSRAGPCAPEPLVDAPLDRAFLADHDVHFLVFGLLFSSTPSRTG